MPTPFVLTTGIYEYETYFYFLWGISLLPIAGKTIAGKIKIIPSIFVTNRSHVQVNAKVNVVMKSAKTIACH